jgi:hypothetical protein
VKNFLLFLLFLLSISCLKAKRSPADLQNSNPANVITNLVAILGNNLKLPTRTLTAPAAPIIKVSTAPNSLTLTWAAATKNVQSDITYRVYRSLNPAFDTVAQIEAGEALNTATPGITSYTINGILSGSGDYYYNIIANDGTNKIAYTKLAYSIGDPKKMVFFAHANPVNGNMGGLAGANALCLATKNANYATLICGGVRAFISVNGSNLKDANTENFFVPNRPIFGIHNLTKAQTEIVSKWDDFMAYALPNGSVTMMNVLGYPNSQYFYSFSSDVGYNMSNNCNNGQSSSNSLFGNGVTFDVINGWKFNAIVNCDGVTTGVTRLLCLCY